jgi:peroxiredoxin
LFAALLPWLSATAPASSPAESPLQRQLLAAPSATRPDFTLPDLSGSMLSLQQQAGKVVLVHFFATWCEPCREELASLSRLTEGALGKRVSILAVNVAEVPLRVRRFLDTAPVTFPVVLDADRAVTRAWSVAILPTTFVLDPTLQPRLFVEGDIDWSRPDIAAALEALDADNAK